MTAASANERLTGSTVLLTGGTGFLGKTVLWTLLERAPDLGRLIVLLRAADAEEAQQRLVGTVLKSEAFSALPEARIKEWLESGRLLAVGGDLEADDLGQRLRGSLGGVDTVIHCAASVSFEEPLDTALALNAFGPIRLLDSLHSQGASPHFVHVSTAYAADCRQQRVHEDGPPPAGADTLDPVATLALAREWRAEAEKESARASQRKRFQQAAKRDALHRQGMDPAERAEELRRRWVRERLAEQGRQHAIAAGWPDTYAFSKAAAERLLAERSARTTILRPSIIESALRHPFPGWLEGVKVADPLILAYAAGGLTHLPGRATNRIDIVPVDYVANACVTAGAHPPSDQLRVVAITSTGRNALTLGELAGHIRACFRREPLLRRDGSPIQIGDLKFVDRKEALRHTVRRERLLAAAAKMAALPLVPLSLEATLRRNRALAARVTRMVKIYGPYTELDCVFDDRNARELSEALSDEDRSVLRFDLADINWQSYLEQIHLPQVRSMAASR